MGAERPCRIGVEEALGIIAAAVRPLEVETVAIHAGHERITAAAIYALQDTPRYQVAAMDGFAIDSGATRHATAGTPVIFQVGPLIAAGHWPVPLGENHSAAIATGAPVPAGADTVVTRENAVVGRSGLVVGGPVDRGRNVRQIGEDMAKGQMILQPGVRLGPAHIGALAAFGVDQVRVRRTPRVGLLATGSELVDAGGASFSPSALIDSNTPMLAACVYAARLDVRLFGRAPDRPAEIDALLGLAAQPEAADIILSTGGVSVGDFDLMPARLRELGCTVLFHGIAMRPGKPLLFALLPDGRPFFGLPGTPLAALVGFRFFVGAAIRRMLGLGAEVGQSVETSEPGRAGTSLFLRARQSSDGRGRLSVDTSMDQRAHILHSLLQANCWLRVDHHHERGPTARMFPSDLPVG